MGAAGARVNAVFRTPFSIALVASSSFSPEILEVTSNIIMLLLIQVCSVHRHVQDMYSIMYVSKFSNAIFNQNLLQDVHLNCI